MHKYCVTDIRLKILKWSNKDAENCDAIERRAVSQLYNGEQFKTVLHTNESR